MKKVMLVFGTRPEAIKMAPLVLKLQQCQAHFQVVVCVTGQHREMLDQVLTVFGIEPRYDLNIMQPNQDLYDISSKILLGVRNVLDKEQPDVVLVHGDTTTSMVSALAAFYRQIPVGHVEAGLRTENIYSPWPEEANRQITSRIATYHFAPTPLAQHNLLAENVPSANIIVTGNTVIDALHVVITRFSADMELSARVASEIASYGYDVHRLENANCRRMVLVTGHRRENFGDGFLHICNAIKHLAEKYSDVDFVYPMHLNPNVRKPVLKILDGNLPNVFLIEPLGYLPFVYMMEKATLILTDSGGVQEEAPSLGKPVLVMRDTTERPEAVEAGTVRLVGTDERKIGTEVSNLLDNASGCYDKMAHAENPYGDGRAVERIVDFLKNC